MVEREEGEREEDRLELYLARSMASTDYDNRFSYWSKLENGC